MSDEKRVWFERHRDDEYIDEIVMRDGRVPRLRIHTAPRYKTSGMSGDEWRVSAMIVIADRAGDVVVDNGASKIQTAAARAAAMLFEFPTSKLTGVDMTGGGVLELRRKGRVILSREYGWFASAVASLPWTLYVGSEASDWKDDACEDLCFQPGCAEPFTNEYRIKSLFDRDGTALGPRSWTHTHRRFCTRHAERGDCGLEDADANYEVISGPGPDGAVLERGDVRPSLQITVDGAEFMADPKGTLDAAVSVARRPGNDQGRDS